MFLNLLTVLFIGLKLTHYIDWSWWLVLLPTYAPWVFFGSVFLLSLVTVWLVGGEVTWNDKKFRIK
jgi:hypothetical protein